MNILNNDKNLEDTKEDMKNLASDAKKMADDKVEQLAKQVNEILDRLDDFSSKKKKFYNKSMDKIASMKDDVVDCCSGSKIVDKVKENPVHSTLILLTLGVILGAVINKYKE